MNVIANANDQANNLKQLSQQSLLWRRTNFCKKPKSLPTPGLSVASKNKVREGGKKPQLIYRTRHSSRRNPGCQIHLPPPGTFKLFTPVFSRYKRPALISTDSQFRSALQSADTPAAKTRNNETPHVFKDNFYLDWICNGLKILRVTIRFSFISPISIKAVLF